MCPSPSTTTIVLPGFVNAHSHAFHRHLRGKSGIGGKAADTFWKWRDNITVTPHFARCWKTGITTVGEFHYVHHGTGKFDLDSTVLKAAQDAGIRITLIQNANEHAMLRQNRLLHPVHGAIHSVSSYSKSFRITSTNFVTSQAKHSPQLRWQ
ncbi:N-formimino-L-glutamate deiminase domain protein, partial [Ostertagia ostertagi]